MKKFKSGNTLDPLSELPDSLILKILSFLRMRDAVRTTLLSKRWNDLWTTIPCLCFSHDDFSNDAEKVGNFINRALLVWKGTKIQKFEIHFPSCFDESLYRDMLLWLRFVTERKVEELDLSLSLDEDDFPSEVYLPPHRLYECSSIRKLSLDLCYLRSPRDVHWDQLKSLTIRCHSVSEDVINQAVSGAPQLEIFELTIFSDCNENLSIRSSSLKKLSIHRDPNFCIDYEPTMYAMLTIWTPNLETLITSGSPYNKCLLVDVSSLTDVTLDFRYDWDVVLGETLRQILPTFQHVEKLTLSASSFEVLAVMIMKGECSFSPLLNVKILRLTCDKTIKLDEIVGLLEIFPKLKMLDIVLWSFMCTAEPLNSEVNTIKSLMMQLRIVEIGWNKYDKSIFELIEFFLKHATVLEKMVFQKFGHRVVESGVMILAAEKLLSLQRSFPTVELIFWKK